MSQPQSDSLDRTPGPQRKKRPLLPAFRARNALLLGIGMGVAAWGSDASDACLLQDRAPSVSGAIPSVVVVGSSTAYSGAITDRSKGYAWRLGELLRQRKPGECLVNLAYPGYNTLDARSAGAVQAGEPTPDEARNIDRALRLGAALVIIHLPTNDAYDGIPVDKTRDNFLDMVRRADSAGSRVLLLGPQPRDMLPVQLDSLMRWKQVFDSLSGVETLPIWDSLALDPAHMFPELDQGDQIHPNDSGHAILFRAVERTPAWQAIAPGAWNEDPPLEVPRPVGVVGPAPGNYLPGTILTFQVAFSRSVTVTGAASLRLTVGSNPDSAPYAGGSGSDTLIFRYRVPLQARDSDGIVVGRWIDPRDGQILDSAGNHSALNIPGTDMLSGIALPGNRPPEIVDAIRDTTVEEDFTAALVYKLDSRFRDPDGQPLSYSVCGGCANLRTTLSHDTLRILPKPDRWGPDTLIVVATDASGESVSDTFTIHVVPVNDAPVVAIPFADTSAFEDFESPIRIPMGCHFSDPDGDALGFQVRSAPGIVSARLEHDTLVLQARPDSNGTGFVVVRAYDDSGAAVLDSFRITVRSINDAPIVAAHLADSTVVEDFAPAVRIPLTSHFADPDGSIASYQIASAPSVVATGLAHDTLVIEAVPNAYGNGFITIRAVDDSGVSVLDSFRITVRSINDAPVVAVHLDDLALEESFASPVFIPLAPHFTDPDGRIASYQVSVDTALVRANLVHDTLRLLDKPLVHGTEKVRITAFDDSGASISDSFTITLTPPGGSTEILSKAKNPARISTSGPAFAVARAKTLVDRLPATSTGSPEFGLSSQGACRNTTGCSSLPVQPREPGSLDVSIFDNLGARVIATSVRVGPLDLQRMQRDPDGVPSDRIEWNQRDTRGQVVPTGVYLWRIEFISDRGETIRTVVKMGIRPNPGN